jgi:hypothetical protein
MQIYHKILVYNLVTGPSTSTHGKQMMFHASEPTGDEMNKIYRTVNPNKVAYSIPAIIDVHVRIQ